jgi:hypothetical protein
MRGPFASPPPIPETVNNAKFVRIFPTGIFHRISMNSTTHKSDFKLVEIQFFHVTAVILVPAEMWFKAQCLRIFMT